MGALDAEVERARPEFAQWAAGSNAADPDDAALAARWLAAQPADDAALLGAALSTADIAASVREALACHDGYLRDAALLFSRLGLRPLGHPLPHPPLVRRPRRPQPTRTGQWWADRIAGAELTVTPDDPPGHAAGELADVLAALRHT